VGQAGEVTTGESIRGPPIKQVKDRPLHGAGVHEAVWIGEPRIGMVPFVHPGGGAVSG
jgi:hypothetical protein